VPIQKDSDFLLAHAERTVQTQNEAAGPPGRLREHIDAAASMDDSIIRRMPGSAADPHQMVVTVAAVERVGSGKSADCELCIRQSHTALITGTAPAWMTASRSSTLTWPLPPVGAMSQGRVRVVRDIVPCMNYREQVIDVDRAVVSGVARTTP